MFVSLKSHINILYCFVAGLYIYCVLLSSFLLKDRKSCSKCWKIDMIKHYLSDVEFLLSFPKNHRRLKRETTEEFNSVISRPFVEVSVELMIKLLFFKISLFFLEIDFLLIFLNNIKMVFISLFLLEIDIRNIQRKYWIYFNIKIIHLCK